MPYVARDKNGTIISLFDKPTEEAQELLEGDHPEVTAFLIPDGDEATLKALAKTDREIARVTEDLINLLVHKQVILFTELPTPVQKKLLAREKLRSEIYGGNVCFLDDEDTI